MRARLPRSDTLRESLPMLPPALTAKISLKEGQPGLAHSHFFTVDGKSGEILQSRREHTLITVGRRLDYDAVRELTFG